MATYNLNVTTNFCLHWGLWEAIREILQNGEDELVLNPYNDITVDYNLKTKTLIISNKDSILERRSLLFGGTSKLDNDDTIGRFGEGYKIALLILIRMGKSVVIKNFAKNEKWIPSIEADKKYDNEDVLKVNIHKYVFKRLPDNNLSFEIKGIEEDEWKAISKNYLRFQELGKTFEDSKKSQILFDPKYKGKVFINGLFVEQLRDDYKYGYNLHSSVITLNRDRQSIQGYDFNSITNTMIGEYAQSSKDSAEEVFNKVIKERASDVNSTFSFYNVKGKNLVEAAVNDFKSQNSERSFPVSDQKEADYIKSRYQGVETVIVSEKEKLLFREDETYKDIESFIDEKSNMGIDFEQNELTPFERLSNFLEQHKYKIYDDKVLSDLESIVAESKNWKFKPNELDKEPENIQNEEDNIVEEPENIEENLSIKSSNSDEFEFEDDIPF